MGKIHKTTKGVVTLSTTEIMFVLEHKVGEGRTTDVIKSFSYELLFHVQVSSSLISFHKDQVLRTKVSNCTLTYLRIKFTKQQTNP